MSWFSRFQAHNSPPADLDSSILYDETRFYKQFAADLLGAKKEVIVESPFISAKRMEI